MTEVAKPSRKSGSPARWYAIYTRSRWEKKVNQLLTERGFECYCPLNKVTRRWSDRVKIVEEPLFKSYVFVKITDKERTAVRMVNGIINFVYWQGKPALIREKEIATIRKFLDEHDNVSVAEMSSFSPRQRVKIISGPLMDQEGEILQIRKRTVQVAIDSLGYILIALIDRKKLTSVRQ